MKQSKYWKVAYRKMDTQQIVGPVIIEIKSKIRPGRLARMNCPAGCEFAILLDEVDAEGFSILGGARESELQAALWERIER